MEVIKVEIKGEEFFVLVATKGEAVGLRNIDTLMRGMSMSNPVTNVLQDEQDLHRLRNMMQDLDTKLADAGAGYPHTYDPLPKPVPVDEVLEKMERM